MSRSFSASALREILAQNSSEVFLTLLTISGTGLATPIRVVDNTENVTSRSNVYTAFPFAARLPDDTADEMPSVQITISNIDRSVIDAIRSAASPLTMTLEIVAASSPNTVEVGPFTFNLASADYNVETITATLAYEPLLNEPFPAGTFNPQQFPALFGVTS